MKPVKRYRVRITTSGYIFILVTILLSIGAANTGNNLLYLLTSALLAVMLASGISSLINLSYLELSLHPPGEVFAGLPAPFRIKIRKKGGFPSFFLHLKLKEGDKRGIILSRRKEQEVVVWLGFEERGLITLSKIHVGSGFPFGFFIREKLIPIRLSVLVLPTPRPAPFLGLEGEYMGESADRHREGSGDEVRELRPYRNGDPLKWVHWRATARRGSLISKEFFDTHGNQLLLRLDRDDPGWERRLEEATYLVLEAHKRRMPYGVLLPEKEILPDYGEAHKKKVLKSLALA